MNRKLTPLSALSALLLSASLLLGCYEAESRVTQTIDESWEAGLIEGLDLETVNGRVEVRASASGQVAVHAEVRSSSEPQKDIVRFSVEDGILKIREKWPRGRASILPFKHGHSGSVRYQIDVPEHIALEIDTTNGRMETYGVRGDQSLTSVNGRIEVDTPSSQLEARTVNGRIEARFREEFPGARLKTVNGSVKVFVPSGTRVSADIDQVNGSFNSRLPVIVNAGDDGDGVLLRVTTVNGSVTLDEIDPPVSDPELPQSEQL